MSRCKKRKLTLGECQSLERRRTSRMLRNLNDELDIIKTGIVHQAVRLETYRQNIGDTRDNPALPQLDDQKTAIETVQSKLRRAIKGEHLSEDTSSSDDNLAPRGLISSRQDDLESSIEETVTREILPHDDPFLLLGARPKTYTQSLIANENVSDRSLPTTSEDSFSLEGVVPNTEGHIFNGNVLVDVDFAKLKIRDNNTDSSDEDSVHKLEIYQDYPEFCSDDGDVPQDPGVEAAQLEVDRANLAQLERQIENEIPCAQDPSAPDGVMQDNYREMLDNAIMLRERIAKTDTSMMNASTVTVEEPSLLEMIDEDVFAAMRDDVIENLSETEREFSLPTPEEIIQVDQVCDGARGLPLNYRTIKLLKKEEKMLPTQEEQNEFFYQVFDMCATSTYMQVNQRDIMLDLFRAECPDRKLRGNRTCFKKFIKGRADVKMFYEFRNLETDQVVEVESKTYPRNVFPRDQWEKRSEYAFVPLQSVYEHAQKTHETKREYVRITRIVLFVDGLPTSKSSHENLTMFAVEIIPCTSVYVIGMHLYKRGAKLSVNKIMEKILAEMQENKLALHRVIADAPMRAKLKGLKQFNGTFSCEVCEAVGVILGRRTVFPASTMDAKERSSMEWFDIALRIQANGIETFSKEELKGIMCATPLSLLPDFDIINDFLLEPMHNLSGNAKKLIQLTLGFNDSTKTLSIRQTQVLTKFDKRWIQIKLPREFNRRARSIIDEFVNYKSQELISIVIAGFLAVAEALEEVDDDAHNIVTTWMKFAYIVRSCMFDNVKLDKIMVRTDLQQLSRDFYTLYEETHGLEHCTWNIHTFSHLLRTRKLSRLPPLSALKFEGRFSFVKKVMKTNTTSFPKQVIEKVFMRNASAHDCENTVNFNTNSSSRFGDNIVYTEDSIFYKIFDSKSDAYIGNRFLTTSITFPSTGRLNWQVVGVERWDRLDDQVQVITKKSIIAKGVIDCQYIIAVPFDSLFT